VGREKEGRVRKSGAALPGGLSLFWLESSSGITCCNNLLGKL